MNAANIIIGLIITVLFGLSVYRIIRHRGSCEACGGACGAAGCACHCHDKEKSNGHE